MTHETNLYNEITTHPLREILTKYPHAHDYLANMRLENLDTTQTFTQALERADTDILEEFGHTKESVILHFTAFLSEFTKTGNEMLCIQSLTILGGKNKSGEKENITLTVTPGEIISIVGPTGSGKSRLLEDIECLAQCDTPTERKILINGITPNEETRFSSAGKLVAQLSQNMNFVMDISVFEFLIMHAKSRMISDPETTAEKCFTAANKLAGEKFTKETKVTQLSGGQSRALMIADTALMSSSPIVLIDEIENAGIDRRLALNLLAKGDKIILMSTHDPLLALNGKRRIVISNGGIAAVLDTTEEELKYLEKLESIDAALQNARNALRYGKRINEEIIRKAE